MVYGEDIYILFTLHSAALLEMRLSSVMYYLYTPSTRLFPPGRKMNCFEYILRAGLNSQSQGDSNRVTLIYTTRN